MLILIDGYNVIAPIAPPGRGSSADWLRIERQRLIELLASRLGAELARETTVVFDAASAPLGVDSRFVEHEIEVLFAVGYPEADDLIEELIAANSTPKKLTVVSSDHRIQASARRRGALAVDSDVWLDRLSDGRPLLAIPWRPGVSKGEKADEKPTNTSDVAGWLAKFGFVDAHDAAESGQSDPIRDESSQKSKSPQAYNPFPPGYGEDLL